MIYETDNNFPVLPIKDMINKNGKRTTSFKPVTGTKPSVSYLHMIFVPCAIRKATENVDKKALNMCHQVQKGFQVIFVGITKHQKVYLVYA